MIDFYNDNKEILLCLFSGSGIVLLSLGVKYLRKLIIRKKESAVQSRTIVQNGDKSQYIERIEGNITIN